MNGDPNERDPADDTPGARLTRLVSEAIVTEVPARVRMIVHAPADGASVTLDCETGAHLSDAADPSASAAMLLTLCASLADADLRIGLVGEYDDVHLYLMLPTADLDATDLVDRARSLASRAEGLQTLIGSIPPLQIGQGGR